MAELHQSEMRQAIAMAQQAAASGEIPVGALILGPDSEVIAAAANRREQDHDPTAHAEIVALRAAAQSRKSWNFSDCTLIVTMEPCVMCAGVLSQARIGRVVFGAWDEKAGGAGSVYDILRDRRLPHRAEVIGGVLEEENVKLLKEFFESKR